MTSVKWLERIMNTVADRGRDLIGLRSDAERPPLTALCHRLVAGRGEASNIALAREILQRFEQLGEGDKLRFFYALADEFAPDPQRIQEAVAAYLPDDPATLTSLLDAVEPPRQELFRRLNMAPQGTASLVKMRQQLLDLLSDHRRLKSVDADLLHLLSSWFNRGFLRLQRIDWNSPAVVLEKLMRYEAVHPIQGWGDLRRRLGVDRRCFGFFHPALPDEPLIFVEVALTRRMADKIAPLIDPDAPPDDPYKADTAMFYSINNALHGLRGVSFGNFLLKQVLSDLGEELPHLKHFVTLSPMPRFAKGLRSLLAGEFDGWPIEAVDRTLADLQPALYEYSSESSPSQAVAEMLRAAPQQRPDLLTEPLARLALLYLAELKTADGHCYDPVAAFHLANGAIMERINVAADMSAKGEAQSHGLMVNYRYDPDQVVANHESFVDSGSIAMSRALRREHDKHLTDDS